MQITVNRNKLGAALTFLGGFLPSRPPLPVLGGIRLEVTKEGVLHLVVSDYETAARAEVVEYGADRLPAKRGTALVDGRALTAAVRRLPAGKTATVTLRASAGRFEITGSSAPKFVQYEKFLPPGDYPTMPPVPAEIGATDRLTGTISRVAPVASTDDTLPTLTCVQITTSPSGITLAATDDYHLAVEKIDWTPTGAAETGDYHLLIPAWLLRQFTQTARGQKVSIHYTPPVAGIAGAGPLAGLSAGGHSAVIRMMEGTFPDWRKLIDRKYTATVKTGAALLADAIRRAGGVAGRNMPITLIPGRGKMTVTATRDGNLASSEEVKATTGDLVFQPFSVNPAYLFDLVAPHDEVTLHSQGPEKPAGVTVTGLPGYQAVIMPVRRAS